jgi:FkbM family methyltransferase
VTDGRVLRAAARRLGRRPRLATAVLRLPRVLLPRLRATAYRSFSWPLAKGLGTEAVVSVAGGSRMLVRTDDAIGRVLAISGLWEPNVTAAFRQRLAPGDVCVDVGAHVGYFSLLASKLVGDTGHVYAFEPSPSNYQGLRGNLERNGVTNVTAFPFAAGERARRAALHEGPGTNSGRATLRPVRPDLTAIEEPGLPVEVRPVASCIPGDDQKRVRVIKVDVEGSELEALQGLIPIFELGERLALFVEFNPGWIDDADAIRRLDHLRRAYGFTLQRLSAGYLLETLFPGRVEAPIEIAEVPHHECDLLLTR